jgi:hypothetical protein
MSAGWNAINVSYIYILVTGAPRLDVVFAVQPTYQPYSVYMSYSSEHRFSTAIQLAEHTMVIPTMVWTIGFHKTKCRLWSAYTMVSSYWVVGCHEVLRIRTLIKPATPDPVRSKAKLSNYQDNDGNVCRLCIQTHPIIKLARCQCH